jgi:drug/metabolite transporter (DMT)-like permease
LNVSADFGYAVVAMVCYGAADLVYKRAATGGVKPHHFLMVQAWLFAPAMLAYSLATGTLHFSPAAGWGMVAGLCVFVGLYNFSRSLRDGAVSVNAPIFRLNFTLTVILAVVVLGEPLGSFKLAGLALALLAVWLLLGGPADGNHPPISRASLLRVLLATIAMGIANFCYKLGVLHGATPATMVVAQASTFFPLATVFGYLPERKFNPPAATWPYAACAALLLAIAFMMLATSLVHGEASVLVPVAQMGFVMTAAAGILVLREGTSARGIVGLLVAVGALACLAAS